MAKPKKIPTYSNVKLTDSGPPQAPWRVWFSVEDEAGRKARKFKSFSTMEKAIAFAEDKDREIANHGIRYGDISPEARRAFDAYRDRAADLSDKGLVLPPFEELVADAIKRIVDAYEESQRAHEARITVAEAVEEFNAFKKTRVGARQAQDYNTRLKRFSKTHGTSPVEAITAAVVESWLDALRSKQDQPLGVISRNNMRTTIHTFLEFCRKRGWVNANAMADTEREKATDKEPLAYTPEETTKLLLAALEMKSPALPSLVLGFFCGLRVSETLHVDLGRIDLEEAEFRVSISKTGPRMAPLLPAAVDWLSVCPRTGKAWDTSIFKLMREVGKVREAAKIRRIANGPRHSFITYRTADLRDVGRVADECGNSVQMVNDNYRAIVSGTVAKSYFEIRPPASGSNIIQLRA